MEKPKPHPADGTEKPDIQIDQLNKRIDKALERFDKMRKDYRFLAGPNWRETDR